MPQFPLVGLFPASDLCRVVETLATSTFFEIPVTESIEDGSGI